MTPAVKVTAEFMPTSPKLRRYLAGIFLIEIEVEGDAFVDDLMFPDWAALRFNHVPDMVAHTRDGPHICNFRFLASGPRTRETYMRTRRLRQWGVLLHPVGWALLVGEPAHEFANRMFDGMTTPAFEKFRPLAETLFGPEPDRDGELERLTRFFEDLEPIRDPAVGKIAEVYTAHYDPGIGTVGQLADRVRVNRRTLERLCRRAFGFGPKMVLRRRRFVRSLIHFTVDPSLKWIGAIDESYHDQAQFVRDFHDFMGMTPREYGQRPKPLVELIMRERFRYARQFARELAKGGIWDEFGQDF